MKAALKRPRRYWLFLIGDEKKRDEARLAFCAGVGAFAAWLFKQARPPGQEEGLALLRANVERYARAVHASSLTLRRYSPEACLEWLRNNGLEAARPAPKALPPPPLAPAAPRIYRVDLRRGAENARLAALTASVLAGMGGAGRPGIAKTREQQLAELERAGAAE